MKDVAALKTGMIARIHAVAHDLRYRTGFELKPDWSNFYESNELIDIIVDVKRVFKGLMNGDEAKRTLRKHYAGLVKSTWSEEG